MIESLPLFLQTNKNDGALEVSATTRRIDRHCVYQQVVQTQSPTEGRLPRRADAVQQACTHPR